jgi:hypothetical protein
VAAIEASFAKRGSADDPEDFAFLAGSDLVEFASGRDKGFGVLFW